MVGIPRSKLFVSSSKTYALFLKGLPKEKLTEGHRFYNVIEFTPHISLVENSLNVTREDFYVVKLPEPFENNRTKAQEFLQNFWPRADVVSCLTYEEYLKQAIKVGFKTQPDIFEGRNEVTGKLVGSGPFPWGNEKNADKVALRNHDISQTISPSRKYVVVMKDFANPDRENIYEIRILPELYENTTWGARNYYLNEIDGIAKITRVVPRELYLAEIQSKNDLAKATDQGTLTPFRQSRELIDKIKTALGNFYFVDHFLQDSEIIELLSRMMDDIHHHEVKQSRIEHILKEE